MADSKLTDPRKAETFIKECVFVVLTAAGYIYVLNMSVGLGQRF